MASLHHELDDAVRAKYRAAFAAEVAAGTKMPFVIPYTLLGAFILPTLWLSVSQKRYPWFSTTRWLLAAFILAFNVYVAARTSSANIAMSYATGLLTGWGIMYNLNLLIWTNPQAMAARIVRRKDVALKANASLTPEAVRQSAVDGQSAGLRQRGSSKVETDQQSRDLVANGHAKDPADEYIWQPFPHDAPWKERFNWALDLTTSFRGCGKHHLVPLIEC
jgi:hypothetical protein